MESRKKEKEYMPEVSAIEIKDQRSSILYAP